MAISFIRSYRKLSKEMNIEWSAILQLRVLNMVLVGEVRSYDTHLASLFHRYLKDFV